jgi:LmbE family N-acetylglucosaminyl deacetylase
MAANMPTLLAVFAHPDDETFRPGGTLALLTRCGVRVKVLTFTRGEAGSCGNPPLCTLDELPAVREYELHCASVALGVQTPRLLEYPDGYLAESDSVRTIAEILAVIRKVQPKILLSFGPDGLSNHPDHIAVGQWTAEAYLRSGDVDAFYTLAVPQSLAEKLGMKQVHPVPDKLIALTVDISSVWETKLSAMCCHATQWSSSPMANAPEEQHRLFFGNEHFVCAASRTDGDDFLPFILREYLQ